MTIAYDCSKTYNERVLSSELVAHRRWTNMTSSLSFCLSPQASVRWMETRVRQTGVRPAITYGLETQALSRKKKKGLVVNGLDKAVKVGDLVWT